MSPVVFCSGTGGSSSEVAQIDHILLPELAPGRPFAVTATSVKQRVDCDSTVELWCP